MSNIKKIQEKMKEQELSALLLTDDIDRLYAVGFHSSAGAVLVLRDKAYYITDSRYIEAAREKARDVEVLQCTIEKKDSDIIGEILAANGITELGAQDESLSYSEYLKTQEKLGVTLVPAQGITVGLREVKEDYEVENMIAAQRIAEKAFDYIIRFIRPGVTEKDIAAELEYQMTKNGAEGLAFDTICVSGINSSRPHGVPSDKKIEAGDFVTMDYGCKVGGYCSDMTRTIAVGHASEEMKKVYEVVLAAQIAAIEVTKAGVIGRDIDKAARDIINAAGYGDNFGHGLGHSVGLFIHEGPNASPKEDRPIPKGAVITSEPGIYIPGKFGVRIEDMIYVTENQGENLTKAPKTLIIL